MSADRTTADPLEAALAILAPKHVTRDYRPADAAADAIRKEFARVQSALTPLPADTVCACLDETGERKVRHYERCERCHALMESDLPRDLRDVSVRMLAAEAGVEELQRALQEAKAERDRAVAAMREIQRKYVRTGSA